MLDLTRVAATASRELVEHRTSLRGDLVEVGFGLDVVSTPLAPPVGVLRGDRQHLGAVRRNRDRRARALHRTWNRLLVTNVPT
jgi:hypothetical protein